MKNTWPVLVTLLIIAGLVGFSFYQQTTRSEKVKTAIASAEEATQKVEEVRKAADVDQAEVERLIASGPKITVAVASGPAAGGMGGFGGYGGMGDLTMGAPAGYGGMGDPTMGAPAGYGPPGGMPAMSGPTDLGGGGATAPTMAPSTGIGGGGAGSGALSAGS